MRFSIKIFMIFYDFGLNDGAIIIVRVIVKQALAKILLKLPNNEL